MKRLWIAVGILLFVIASCVSALFWQLSAVEQLENSLTAVETAARREDASAIKKAEAFRDECIHITEQLACLSRHIDSFPLRESATQLPILLQQQDPAHFFAEIARCRFYLSELRRSEKPLFGNIF